MREDLPCDESLPTLWSISLAPGGDIVDGGPYLEDFVLLETLQRDRWRVRGRRDGNTYVLIETRFVFPETIAVPNLGRLRELMLREGRLLDTLSHGCVVPLENGWLEQRTGFERAGGVCTAGCSAPLRNSGNIAEDAEERSVPAEEGGIGAGLFDSRDRQGRHGGKWSKEGSLRQALMMGVPATATTGGATSCNGVRCPADTPNVCFLAGSGDEEGENDAASFLLRSWVPLTLEDADDGDDADQVEGGELANSTEDPGHDGGRGKKHYGGFAQLRWGGDGTTDWRGTAEPKSPANWPASSTDAAGADKPFYRKSPHSAGITDCNNDGGGGGFAFPPGERAISLASYLLLPDWLPLSVWFETEFEPRTTAQGRQDEDATTGAVTTPDDWALVWRHLLSMFVQVVQGVEHLHTQGLIHNNICPSSVWVASDGRCCVGNLGQAAPPGYRRPPPRTTMKAGQYHHFASPERRQGSRVGAKSDVYSLGVLMLEFWRNYTLSRGLELCLAGIVERVNGEETLQRGDGGGRLDAVLVRSMLEEEPLDRPDCFEVIDSLDGS